MTVLGIETASRICSAAVVENGTPLALGRIDEPRAHAEMLLELITDSLSSASRELRSVDGIAVSVGPGSFTGLRVGLSVAKGLAWSLGKPIVGVPTLRALAVGAARSATWSSGPLLATADARKDEFYCQLFRLAGGVVQSLEDEMLLAAVEMKARFGEEILMTGYSEEARKLSESMPNVCFLPVGGPVRDAAAVAIEGELRLAGNDPDDLTLLEPRYVADFIARTQH